MALTVEITSGTAAPAGTYTLAYTVSGTTDPLDALWYRLNGEQTVDLPAVVGDGTVSLELREGRNTVAVYGEKGAEDDIDVVGVDVPDQWRGLLTAEQLMAALPRSLAEAE